MHWCHSETFVWLFHSFILYFLFFAVLNQPADRKFDQLIAWLHDALFEISEVCSLAPLQATEEPTTPFSLCKSVEMFT